jgi:photosystem II stability/assembly factor-like uncharacterized protein
MRRILGALIVCLCACGDSESWEVSELGTDAEFRDLVFVDDQDGWIVGGSPFVKGGVIGRTRDGGESWEFQSGLVSTEATLFNLWAIEFVDSLTACVVASGGVILRSEDGGETWRSIRRGGGWTHLYDLDFVAETGWAVGLSGVLRSDDGGRHWRPIYRDLEGRAIQFLDAEHGWVVGKHAAAYRTADGGQEWEWVDVIGSTEKPHFYTVHFADGSTGWIAGDGGALFKTQDGGDTWIRQETGVGHTLTRVCFADSLSGWAVGFARDDGTSVVLHTEDGGGSWIIQATVAGEELWAMQVMNGRGWAVGGRVREEPQKLLRFTSASRP